MVWRRQVSGPPTPAMKGSAAQQKDRAQYGAKREQVLKREQILKAAGPVLRRYGLSRTTIGAPTDGVTRTVVADPCRAGEAIAGLNHNQPRQRPAAEGSRAVADVLPQTTTVTFRGGPRSL
jgi:hypothetical protein